MKVEDRMKRKLIFTIFAPMVMNCSGATELKPIPTQCPKPYANCVMPDVRFVVVGTYLTCSECHLTLFPLLKF